MSSTQTTTTGLQTMTRSMQTAQSIIATVLAAALIGAWFIAPTVWMVLVSFALAGVTTTVGGMLVMIRREN